MLAIMLMTRTIPTSLQVLGGGGACPPEDSNGFEGMGNGPFQEFLDDLLLAKRSSDARSQRKYKKLCAEVMGSALNYKNK